VRRAHPHSATVLAAALAAVYLVVDPRSADLAAQTYRTWLFDHGGFVVWDNGWYAGHHVPAYSLLFPPLAWLVGTRTAGALAAVAATWAFERLVLRLRGPADTAGRLAALWFATACFGVLLVSGRLTFALGAALAIGALLALAHGRTMACALFGALAGLASPVAAAFLALALVVWAADARRPRDGAALVVAAVAPAAAVSLAFPEGGDFPFAASSLWPTLAATVVLLIALPPRARALRWGTGLYAVAVLVSGLLATPMGGNAARLGPLVAGPIAALGLWPGRRLVFLALAPMLLYWQWHTPIDDWARAAADPSTRPAYAAGLNAFLDARRRVEGPLRIEIPFTDNHWEAATVATHAPLARGWERQLDRKVNALFYDGRPLTAARYRRWLDDNAVQYVALADAPIDYSAAAEAALVRSRPPYLREVWHDAHWRVFAVRDPTPLATGARVTALGPDRVALVAAHPGPVLLRVRYTPYWRLDDEAGCVSRAGVWTRLDLRRAGAVTLRARFALGRLGADGPRC